jgi:hypothetical protein
MREITLVFVAFLLLFGACRFVGGKRITGNNQVTTENRQVSDFTGVEVAGPYKVYLTQGNAFSVRVEAEENLMEYIITERDGDVLEIKTKRNYKIRSHRDMKIYVSAPNYRELQIAGSGGIWSENKLSHPSGINISIAGSGDVVVDVDAPRIHTEIAGSGSTILKGTTRDLKSEIAGSGDVRAFDLLSENAEVEIAGSGNVQVFASKQLDVSIAGSGDVVYKGGAQVKQSKAGSGTVKKAD